jgi:hypothetical protein
MTNHKSMTNERIQIKAKNPLLLITRLNYELHDPFMKGEHSLIYMKVLKSVIITDPLFSQLIPSNPPNISWIRYSIKISMIFSFEYA